MGYPPDPVGRVSRIDEVSRMHRRGSDIIDRAVMGNASGAIGGFSVYCLVG